MGQSKRIEFDSRGKTWGVTIIRPTDKDLPGLKMKYICESLNGHNGRLIEIGSSSGKHLRSLQLLGYPFEFHGIDIDTESIKCGHRFSPEGNFVVADGHHLPYRQNSFDAVLLMDYVEHVCEPQLATEESRRVLSQGGKLCAFVPLEGNPISLYALFKRLFGFNVKKPAGGHVQDFTISDAVGLIVAQGYRIESVHYSYHVLGALMDFVLFLMIFLNKSAYSLYWEHNKFYRGPQRNANLLISMFNAALTCLNKIAFLESIFLRNDGRVACGIHLTVVRRM
jgi:SAM-dependent methyltransferase